MSHAVGYAARSARSPLSRFEFERREPGPTDVEIEILFCGVCHSDLHTARGEWPGTVYPCVPGHEIVGRVTRVGSDVKGFRVGSLAAVGCMVDSCGDCSACRAGLEQYCEGDLVFTYNRPDRHMGGTTYGGYSNLVVVTERFVLHLPEGLDAAAAAPLLCAGITTYSPLKNWNVGKGTRVGVVGLGGLGHMGVKLARALGAHVVLFTTSPGKTEDARRLGADEVVVSMRSEEMKRQRGALEFILDTVSATHDLDEYLKLLRWGGTLCLVGLPKDENPAPSASVLVSKRRQLAGSMIGGIRETQEMLDFCAARGIVSDIETIPMAKIEEAYARMLASDVKYRFVVDMASLETVA